MSNVALKKLSNTPVNTVDPRTDGQGNKSALKLVMPPVPSGYSGQQVKQLVMPIPTFVDLPGFVPSFDEVNIPISKELAAAYPATLLEGTKAQSALEVETKWEIALGDVRGVRQKLDAMLADSSLLSGVLGAGWKLERVDKYFVKEAGKIVVDKDGDPKMKPMEDTYSDTPNRDLARAGAVWRFRAMEGDKYNCLNIKGGYGNQDKLGTAIRIEYTLPVKKAIRDNPQLGRDFFSSKEYLNLTRFLQDAIPGFDATQVQPSGFNQALRYKYNFTGPNAFEVEISLDIPTVSEILKDGKLGRSHRFGQLEMEVKHKNFGGNTGSSGSGADSTSLAAAAAAINAMGSNISTNTLPRLHQPKDVGNPLLKQDATFLAHQEFVKKMATYLLGGVDKIVPAGQKYAMGMQAIGLIP